MCTFTSLWFLVLFNPSPEEGTFRAYPRPMDFQKGAVSTYLSSIHQVECDGERLYFRSLRDAQVLVTDLEGRMLMALGGTGEHPSEFGANGVLAISVSHGGISALDGGLRFIRFYENGRFISYLRLGSYNTRATHSTSNVFAFSKTHAVVPAKDFSHLALAYPRGGGEAIPVGDLLEIGNEIEDAVPRNATLWCFEDGLWYAAHKFFPMVTVYDERFQVVNQFQVQHALTDQYVSYLGDFKPNERFTKAQVLVSDFKAFRGSLYLMMQGTLFQVHSQSGAVQSRTIFIAEGETFGAADGHQIELPFFAFAEDGALFAVHPALLWNHDFWSVRLPFLDEIAQK